MKAYLVGGAVRDELLGRPAAERDWVVVGATPEELRARGYREVGRDFPVFLHPETHEEHALARTERKTGPGYRGFAVQAGPEVTLEEDLRRRDLTVNAMARDAAGRLIDPHGGRRDLEARLLRHVSPAFREDPVRVLRAARFAARFRPLGFRIADETRELMRAMVADGETAALVPERVFREFRGALAEPAPEAFVEALADCGAWDAVFPEQPEPRRVAALLRRAAAAELSLPARFACAAWPARDGDAFCRRLRAPRGLTRAARLLRAHYPAWAALDPADPDALLALAEALDGARRPEPAADFAAAAETVAAEEGTGRAGAGRALRLALEAARNCDGRAAAARAGSAAEIPAAVHAARLAAVRAALAGDAGNGD